MMSLKQKRFFILYDVKNSLTSMFVQKRLMSCVGLRSVCREGQFEIICVVCLLFIVSIVCRVSCVGVLIVVQVALYGVVNEMGKELHYKVKIMFF